MTNQAFVETAVTTTPKRGRPAKYASAAERQAAYRANNAVKSLRLDGKLAPTIAKLADQFDMSETHVVNNLLRYALANRNFATMGMGGWAMTDRRMVDGKRAAPAPADLSGFDAEFPLV